MTMNARTNFRDAATLAEEIVTDLTNKKTGERSDIERLTVNCINVAAFNALKYITKTSVPLEFSTNARHGYYLTVNDAARDMSEFLAAGLASNEGAAYTFFKDRYKLGREQARRFVVSRLCKMIECQTPAREQPRRAPALGAKLNTMGLFIRRDKGSVTFYPPTPTP